MLTSQLGEREREGMCADGLKPCCVQEFDFGWQAAGTVRTQARRPGGFDAALWAVGAVACKLRLGVAATEGEPHVGRAE